MKNIKILVKLLDFPIIFCRLCRNGFPAKINVLEYIFCADTISFHNPFS